MRLVRHLLQHAIVSPLRRAHARSRHSRPPHLALPELRPRAALTDRLRSGRATRPGHESQVGCLLDDSTRRVEHSAKALPSRAELVHVMRRSRCRVVIELDLEVTRHADLATHRRSEAPRRRVRRRFVLRAGDRDALGHPAPRWSRPAPGAVTSIRSPRRSCSRPGWERAHRCSSRIRSGPSSGRG